MKTRLDLLLVTRKFASSQDRAGDLIVQKRVRVAGKLAFRASEVFPDDVEIEIQNPLERFVSRAGAKLAAALQNFKIDPTGFVVVDIGASTGGFSDCLLTRGASKIIAIELGTRQLHPRLKNDPRIDSREKTDVRKLARSDLPKKIDLIAIDVSFVALEKILPKITEFANAKTEIIALVKPQFEIAPEKMEWGLVSNPRDRDRVLREVSATFIRSGFIVLGKMESPIAGRVRGNREWFVWLRRENRAK